jgi:hypothetical protein
MKAKSIKLIPIIAGILGIIVAILTINEYFIEHPQKNLAGKWKFFFHIESSSYNPYLGKTPVFIVYITQEGNLIKGKGEMCYIDGKELPSSQHIPISLEGTLKNKELRAQYAQEGAKRTSVGEIVVKVTGSGDELTGTYSGTAADSKGPVKAIKVN